MSLLGELLEGSESQGLRVFLRGKADSLCLFGNFLSHSHSELSSEIAVIRLWLLNAQRTLLKAEIWCLRIWVHMYLVILERSFEEKRMDLGVFVVSENRSIRCETASFTLHRIASQGSSGSARASISL